MPQKSTTNIHWLKLIGSISVCLSAGVVGGVFTAQSIPTWYAALNKPSWNPPNWVFGPVWTLLYILMGISLYLLLIAKPASFIKKILNYTEFTRNRRFALNIYAVQLGLNLFWSYLFFGAKLPVYALIEIIVLWIAIAITIFFSSKINRFAAYLLLPYLIWVTFAALLNLAIVTLN